HDLRVAFHRGSPARFDAEAFAASTDRGLGSGGCGDGFRGACLAQHLARAITAATTTGADAKLVRELVDRAGAVAGAFANGLFGHGVADADVQAIPPLRRIITSKAANPQLVSGR